MQIDRDVLADQAVEHPAHVRDALVEHDDLRRQDLAPAEREQLAGERRGAIGRIEDLLDVGAQRRADQLFQQQLGIAANRRQQVVEVVGDAAREPPDRFHLLRVSQLLLELMARGFRGLALGDLPAQLVVGAAERGGALIDAAFEIAMRLVQRHLAGAQLLLSVVTLGDVAQDHQHLVVLERQQARFIKPRVRSLGTRLELDADRPPARTTTRARASLMTGRTLGSSASQKSWPGSQRRDCSDGAPLMSTIVPSGRSRTM